MERARAPCRKCPVFDPAHLDRRTLGDEALRVGILALFVAEVERLLAQVQAAPDPLGTGQSPAGY